MSAPAPARADDGFTLLELLIALLAGGLLIATAAAALFWSLATTGRASEQIEDAARTQLVSSWFLTDVHSAERVEGGTACDEDPPTGTAVRRLASFAWGLWEESETEATVKVDWWLTRAEHEFGIVRLEIERVMCDTDPAWDAVTHTLLTWVDDPAGDAIDPDDVQITCDETRCTATWPPKDGDDPITVSITRRVRG